MTVTQRFEYTSRNLREDLADVTITILDDTGASVVASATMTHKAFGKYVYDFTTSTTGWYHAKMSSDTETRTVEDSKYISVPSTATVSATVTGEYVSTQELNDYMNMSGIIPAWGVGETPAKETVASTVAGLIHYLDHKYVIDGSVTLYYGDAETTETTLTETTHYTIDLDLGKITLTAAGLALATGKNIYGEYKYNLLDLKDSYLRDVLDRAQTQIDNDCNTHFADSTQATPDYRWVTQESQKGKGHLRRYYYTLKYPIANVRTYISGSLASDATTINVDSTAGFASASTLTIEEEQISYSGKTATSFTGCTRGANGTTASAHSDDDLVAWVVVEKSTKDEGETVSWDTLEVDKGVSLNYNAGDFKLMEPQYGDLVAKTTLNIHPLKDVPNRVRISYPYGYGSIPEDIKQCNLMIAAKMLMKSNVARSLVNGQADFRPDSYSINDNEIERILANYRCTRMEYI